MFTGIVEELGRVGSLEAGDGGTRLVVRSSEVAATARVGDSIAVNGVCLTAVEVRPDGLRFDLASETVERSTLGSVGRGDPVNLERPLTLASPLGGHLVQGHVDAVGTVDAVEPDGSGARVRVRLPDGLRRYVAEKGSVAVDGVSLTVSSVDGDVFEVALVPHTLSVTTLGARKPGDAVNVETDVLAKYVESLMRSGR
jgi:riboflavin synthase